MQSYDNEMLTDTWMRVTHLAIFSALGPVPKARDPCFGFLEHDKRSLGG